MNNMFHDLTKYVLPENRPPEIQIVAKRGEILQRVDKVLNDLHIHRSSIEDTRYEFYNDGKQGHYILCRITLKPGIVYSLERKKDAVR